MTTKDFPTAAVLSTITGRLVCEDGIGGVYEVLNWMTGEDVYTHQIPRISKEAAAALIAAQPALSKAIEEADRVTPDNWREWLAVWTERYGETIACPRMTVDQHERIDPLSEAAEKFHPDRIIIAKG
jgi:hypothetical protein